MQISIVELVYRQQLQPGLILVCRDVATSRLSRQTLPAGFNSAHTRSSLTITRLGERVLLAPKIIQHRHSEERLKEGFRRFQQARLGTSHGLHGIDTGVCLEVQRSGCLRVEYLRNSGTRGAGWRRVTDKQENRLRLCVCFVWFRVEKKG